LRRQISQNWRCGLGEHEEVENATANQNRGGHIRWQCRTQLNTLGSFVAKFVESDQESENV